MRKVVFVALALLFLSFNFLGCGLVTPTPLEIQQAYYGPYPENYKNIIEKYMHSVLFDPYSAHYYWSNPPRKAWMNRIGTIYFGWAVECAINAKNRMGGYVGAQTYQFLLRDGQVILQGPWKGQIIE
jgi:hypothetical protein